MDELTTHIDRDRPPEAADRSQDDSAPAIEHRPSATSRSAAWAEVRQLVADQYAAAERSRTPSVDADAAEGSAANDSGHTERTGSAERSRDGEGRVDEPTKTDRIKEHLSTRDLEAARRELSGEVVASKPDGRAWNHVEEVRNAQRGLANRIDQINYQLGKSGFNDVERQAMTMELAQASRLLDHSERYVPRLGPQERAR